MSSFELCARGPGHCLRACPFEQLRDLVGGWQPRRVRPPPFADGACHNGQHRAPRGRTLIVGESLEVLLIGKLGVWKLLKNLETPGDPCQHVSKRGPYVAQGLGFLGSLGYGYQSDQGLHFVGTLGTGRPAGPDRLEGQLNYFT